MRARTRRNEQSNPLLVDIEGIQSMCACGRTTAERIAKESKSKWKVGRRALYSVDKIQEYIDAQVEEQNND